MLGVVHKVKQNALFGHHVCPSVTMYTAQTCGDVQTGAVLQGTFIKCCRAFPIVSHVSPQYNPLYLNSFEGILGLCFNVEWHQAPYIPVSFISYKFI